ncbi:MULTISPECIES: MarR family winged helix-turn-helix transcriptional regulator [Enterococcus]|uniref:MarR family transcriptional regulator n=1 Tax=Enterococcus thailandicus TaxID=417368 RepID=A0A179ES34_ENTTH|nr:MULTISPECIES: MarR family transcriptional regulator [Enterococcus]ASZ08285.1 MarR family transcriptional regulator [Enterococcus thailandicus]MDK4353138.1 MarR family transcriptional regulator [Enterococcus thailandicus]MDT2735278.1 MarR family transcriptional regulator [Enterococcus thailandicus]MDT2751838.1 MarR family transcriptional regulator [Enterococcus thailandicus]MDT2775979.1 MarR family transcriptional regulator [Enterococcus thailandicus]
MSEILREIGIISRSLSYISNVEFKELELNKEQYLYLTRIYENPGIINDAVAELVKQDRTTVSKSVQKLVNAGLVRKEIDAENKKIRRLYATEKAEAFYDYLKREEAYSEKAALLDLSANERETLLKLLKKVSKNVDEEWLFVKNGNKRIY